MADKCDWETGRKASSDCSEQGGPCENRGDCCGGQGLSCDGGTNTCTINGDAKDIAAAFEKELKLVVEEDKCIGDGEGGPEGKCGCKTGDNTDGTSCCDNMVCSYVNSGHAQRRGIEAGFYCSVPGEDVAVEIN